MRKIQILFVLFVLILIQFKSLAQETKYIEVISSETFILKPKSFIYQISFGQQMEFMGMNIPMNNDTDIPQASFTDIENMIKSEQFKYIVNDDNDFSISIQTKHPTIEVELDNLKDLKRLYNKLKHEKGISGKIMNVNYESESLSQDEKFNLLYSKALKQAQQLALVSGNTVGQLFNISEIINESDSQMELYKTMMKNMPLGLLGSQNTLNKEIQRQFMFKFELK
ncbi:hypothetical protein KDU71_19650 [Carboxylicivirga sediminis]|uniref:DUF541 domain-containing protein n=1 Tax=Carboxylicivirga sediminis TaxID=2006564 RepID=A0A941IYE5_9BACT|nr:hypothetical protein [Carboxylicivirga sediminis]MBR8537796.1 hypothetical protein [Carboxylicivirga sediminis]